MFDGLRLKIRKEIELEAIVRTAYNALIITDNA
jgi:hypothetical protein